MDEKQHVVGHSPRSVSTSAVKKSVPHTYRTASSLSIAGNGSFRDAIARNDDRAANLSEIHREVAGQASGEFLVLWRAARIRERQHNDRQPRWLGGVACLTSSELVVAATAGVRFG